MVENIYLYSLIIQLFKTIWCEMWLATPTNKIRNGNCHCSKCMIWNDYGMRGVVFTILAPIICISK